MQKYEFAALINGYLATISNAPVKSLSEIIASGKFHKPSLEKFLASAVAQQNGMEEPDYKERLHQRWQVGHRLEARWVPLQSR